MRIRMKSFLLMVLSVRRNSGERKRRAYSTFPSDVWVFLQRRQRNTDDYL